MFEHAFGRVTAWAILAGSLLGPVPAWAIRAAPWIPGKTILVFLKPGQTTEIIFPQEISEFTNPDGQLFSIQFSGARLLIKPLGEFEPTRLFAVDFQGRNYVVEFQVAGSGQKEDDSVELSLQASEKKIEPGGVSPPRLVLDLFKAMRLERPVAGFQVVEKRGELFYEEPRIVQMRLQKVYDGPTVLGYVVEIENISNEPIRVNPQQFKMKGIVAASVEDMILSAREPENTVEAFKGQPKKTLAYIVVSKAASRK